MVLKSEKRNVYDFIMHSRRKRFLLPLLSILKRIKPSERIIIMSHIDDVTRDALYETINHVLTSESIPLRKRLLLKAKLTPFKNDFRFLTSKKRSSVAKKKKLTMMGGAPLGYVVKTAIPLLLDLYK